MEIGEAYEVLSDPEKRAQYDRFGEDAFKTRGPGGGGGPGGGFRFTNSERVFKWVFGDDNGFSFTFGNGFEGNPRQRRERSPPPPQETFYKDDPYVISLDENNFDEDTFGWVRLVEFYAPWCGHCRALSPKWSALGKSLQGVIKVAAIDCDQFGSVCHRFDVNGYPTIKAFLSNTDSVGIEYEGDRSAKDLERWAVSMIPDHISRLSKLRQMEDFLKQCGGKQSKDKASWHACVLLFTERPSTSPLYRSLSFMYLGKMIFGEVQQKHASLGEAFNITSYPSLIVVCNGNRNTVEVFQKKMQPDRIRTFLNSFAGGRKCNRAIRIDSQKDVETLSSAQLKEILRDRGVSCEGCFEKADYIRRVKEIFAD